MSRAALDDRQRRVLERQSLAEDRGSTTHNPSSDTSSLTQSNRQQLLEQRVLDLLRKQRELESDSSSEYSTLLQGLCYLLSMNFVKIFTYKIINTRMKYQLFS